MSSLDPTPAYVRRHPREELEDVPLYYELARLCNIVKLSQGKITAYLSAILNAGYRVSLTHANKVGQLELSKHE